MTVTPQNSQLLGIRRRKRRLFGVEAATAAGGRLELAETGSEVVEATVGDGLP
ncbi:MAG: hypothetical protein ACKO7W_16450 [Elainella sp.]